MKKIYLKDFGILPDTGLDITGKFQEALLAAQDSNMPCELIFEQGTYDVYCQELIPLDIHISNTNSELEMNSITRNCFMLVKDASNITINGQGSLIKCHGKMTTIAITHSKNISLKNLSIDYVHPVVTEMTVVALGDTYLDCEVAKDSQYRIADGKIQWYGENFAFSNGICQIFDHDTGYTWRMYGPVQDENARWEELSENKIRVYWSDKASNNPYKVAVGHTLQMRNPLRDEVGILIDQSENITFDSVTMHYMNGLGLIAQNTKNIYLDKFSSYPSEGRTCACFADFMHFSGCRGDITIENGTFIGAQDDAINVHGTHLKIEEIDRGTNRVRLRFMHSQTKGIGGFEVGDIVVATDVETLLYGEEAKVVTVQELTPRDLLLTLNKLPENIQVGMVIENVSASANLTVRNNHFERIPTRGILVTTRGKVRISNNTFTRLMRSAVLVANDAASWYESGPVEDILIENNRFHHCTAQFLLVKPENTSVVEGKYVHKNIRAVNNDICLDSEFHEVLTAQNCDTLIFENNKIKANGMTPIYRTEYCNHVVIKNEEY